MKGLPVAITGMGCVTCLGNDVETSWAAAVNGRSGLAPLRRTLRAAPGHAQRTIDTLGGQVADGFDRPLAEIFTRRQLSGVDRFATLAAAATLEALRDAAVLGDSSLQDAAVVYGAASGGNVEAETASDRLYRQGAEHVHPMTVPRCMSSAAASYLSSLFGMRGLTLSISSACASSAHAISEGMHLIRSGRTHMAVVGGSDASLTFGLLSAWRDLQAISRTGCRPFSADRDGTVLAEGAGTLILEPLDTAIARGVHIHAVLDGAGANADSGHITQPCSESGGRAIRLALDDAGVLPGTPMLVSAHGTGTALNDASEARAIADTLGHALNDSLVIATKSLHGHVLGATAAVELILAIRALNAGVAPPIAGCTIPDASCALPLVHAARTITHRTLVSPSFAFGGLNCVLVAHKL